MIQTWPAVRSDDLAYNVWALYFVEQHRWLLDGDDACDAVEARLRCRFRVQLDGYLLEQPAATR